MRATLGVRLPQFDADKGETDSKEKANGKKQRQQLRDSRQDLVQVNPMLNARGASAGIPRL
jgi:hypothetical protein